MSGRDAIRIVTRRIRMDLDRRLHGHLLNQACVLIWGQIFNQNEWQEKLLIKVSDDLARRNRIVAAGNSVDLVDIELNDVLTRNPLKFVVVRVGRSGAFTLSLGRAFVSLDQSLPFSTDDLRIFRAKLAAQIVQVYHR